MAEPGFGADYDIGSAAAMIMQPGPSGRRGEAQPKKEPAGPLQRERGVFTRSNTSSSLTPSVTSSQNTDDEDEAGAGDSKHSPLTYKEKRREAHTQAEQKRRDAIKKGYDALQELVPTCKQSDVSGYKLSKATVLQKSIEYIQHLQHEKQRQEEERSALRKEVVALRIMQTNYVQIVKAQQAQPGHAEARVPDEVKFSVFQVMMDQLFLSFRAVSATDFSKLSGDVLVWLEEHCKPQTLKDLVLHVLRKHNAHMQLASTS